MHDSILEFRFLHCNFTCRTLGEEDHVQQILRVDARNKLGTRNWKCFAGTRLWEIGKLLREMREVATGNMTCGLLMGRPHHVRPIFFAPAGFSRNGLWSRMFWVARAQAFQADVCCGKWKSIEIDSSRFSNLCGGLRTTDSRHHAKMGPHQV